MLKGSYDIQANTLRIFTVLTSLHADWAGSLVLACGLKDSGSDLALAANIAGAACLSIDPSKEVCRAAMRFGAVDFVVNTVDEALRVLKNEIRKQRPLSVALEADQAASLRELMDRGVLPQLFTAFALASADAGRPTYIDAATYFHSQGTQLLDFDITPAPLPFAVQADELLTSYTVEHELRLEGFSFDSAAALRSFDARVLELIPAQDTRRRWVTAASRYFHRNRFTKTPSYTRALFLKPQEREALVINAS